MHARFATIDILINQACVDKACHTSCYIVCQYLCTI